MSNEETEARISQLDRAIADADRKLNKLRTERIDLKLLLTNHRETARVLLHELIDKTDAEIPYGALSVNLIAVALSDNELRRVFADAHAERDQAERALLDLNRDCDRLHDEMKSRGLLP